MPEMHLRQHTELGKPRFNYSVCRPFTKSKEKIQKFKETLDSRHMAYGDLKDLPRRMASDRVLRDKGFNIDKNPKYDVYQRGLPSVVVVLKVKLCQTSN